MSDIFADMNLANISPDLAPVPDGQYNFRVLEAAINEFAYKKDRPEKGIGAGDKGSYVKFGFVIFGDPEHAGRRIYQTIFPEVGANSTTLRGLRRLMDATGVPQTASINDWLVDLVNNKAEFNASLFTKLNKLDNTERPEVRLTTAQPVQ